MTDVVAEPNLHADIPEDLLEILENWRRWATVGTAIPYEFRVACLSAEHATPSRVGDTGLTAVQALWQSIRRSKALYDEPSALAVEIALLRVHERERLALRLYFVYGRRVPLKKKCKLLNVTDEGYFRLVESSALSVRRVLDSTEPTLPAWRSAVAA